MHLTELIYQSESNTLFTDQDMNELLDIASANNCKHKITGCLIYYNKTFIQVLEGEKSSVQQLFKNIIADRRHSKIQMLWQAKIEERGFNGWSMSLINLEDSKVYSLFSNFMDEDKLPNDVKDIITVSKTLLKDLKSKSVHDSNNPSWRSRSTDYL